MFSLSSSDSSRAPFRQRLFNLVRVEANYEHTKKVPALLPSTHDEATCMAGEESCFSFLSGTGGMYQHGGALCFLSVTPRRENIHGGWHAGSPILFLGWLVVVKTTIIQSWFFVSVPDLILGGAVQSLISARFLRRPTDPLMMTRKTFRISLSE